jgi:pyruvate/2-oxoglutarate dehydrogenase complex dihydrolipoamide acyltransferase (E2) component
MLRRLIRGAHCKVKASSPPSAVFVRGRAFSSLPDHQVVGMPALSPTMESGTIGKWLMKEGDTASPGDALAEIETDKASMAFECTDDIVIAKILVSEGTEVKVGDPIMVTVEEGDISAFADFVAPAAPATPVPNVEAAVPGANAVTAPAPGPAPAPAAAAAPAAGIQVPVNEDTFVVTHSVKTMRGAGSSVGALGNKMAMDQNAYQEKYGHQLHKPLSMPVNAKK